MRTRDRVKHVQLSESSHKLSYIDKFINIALYKGDDDLAALVTKWKSQSEKHKKKEKTTKNA